MKKILTLIFLFILFPLLIGCSMMSFKTQSYKESETSNGVEVFQENTLKGYANFINSPTEDIISKYGNPSLKDTLYGGDIYYYEDQQVAFGVDHGVISSVLIYQGELNDKIKINDTLQEVLENVELKESDIKSSNEFPQHIVYTYEEYTCYLIFYDEILREILIRN